MPKVVDHDARRTEIVSAAWKLIADEGLDAVTTRRIAESTGYSNGSLRYYFPGKDAVIVAVFQHIFDATNTRASAAGGVGRGLPELRTLAVEILPLDERRLDEARVAIAFWHRALHDPEKAELFTVSMSEWREQFDRLLHEARIDGDLHEDVDHGAVINELMSMLMGLQILAVLTPGHATESSQIAQLDAFLDRLSRPRNVG